MSVSYIIADKQRSYVSAVKALSMGKKPECDKTVDADKAMRFDTAEKAWAFVDCMDTKWDGLHVVKRTVTYEDVERTCPSCGAIVKEARQ